MNNLIEFLKQSFHYFVAIVLLIISFLMIGKSMSYSSYKFARICQNMTGPIQKSWSEFFHKFNLGQENELLVQQNIALMREHDNMFTIKDDTVMSEMSKTDSIHTTSVRLYDYSYANVIFANTNQGYNYIIIDKGSKDGIYRDMAVTSAKGVVGVVKDVSENFASITTLLHPESRISAIVSPANQVGTVIHEGTSHDIAYLENIPQHLEINIGDSVFTSGYSTIFPKQLLIGTVSEVRTGKNASFLTIKLKLATDFKKIHTVYLIDNIYKEEQDSLISKFKVTEE